MIKYAHRVVSAIAVIAIVTFAPAAHAFCLYDCSPSDNDVQNAFEREIEHFLGQGLSGPDKPYIIEKFQKTNEMTKELGDVKAYGAQYSATVLFPNGYWAKCFEDTPHLPLACAQISINSVARTSTFALPRLPKGTRQEFNGMIEFHKTEKGWQTRDGKIY